MLGLFCVTILSGCGSNNSKLYARIEKVAKQVTELSNEVDELSGTTSSSDNTKTQIEKSNKTSNSSEQTEKKQDTAAGMKDLYAKDAIVEDDKAKVNVTKVDFVEDIASAYKEYGSEGLVIVYYTIENLGAEKIQPSMIVNNYIYASEEDDATDTRLNSDSTGLNGYKEFQKLDESCRLQIKSNGKIETVAAYRLKNKNIKVQIGSYDDSSKEESSIAAKSFSPKKNRKSFQTK